MQPAKWQPAADAAHGMETHVRTTNWHAPPSVAALLLPVVGTSLALSLTLTASLLLIRRFSGAAAMPLCGWCLLASGGALAAARWAICWAWACGLHGRAPRSKENWRAVVAWMRHAAAGVASGLMLLAVSTPASGSAFLAGAWLMWLASEAAAWYFGPAVAPLPLGWNTTAIAPRCRDGKTEPHAGGSALKGVPPMPLGLREKEGEADPLSPNLVQQVTRVLEEDGERVHVLAKVAIEAGDCIGVLHLALSPPLDSPPDLAACVVDEPGATVRVTDAESYGARVEVRLLQPVSQRRAVWLEIHGVAPSHPCNADLHKRP